MYRRFGKRIFDVILSTFGILFLVSPMALVSLSIKMDSKGPICFRQIPMGKSNSEFEILKFRSMSTETLKDVPTHLLGDASSFITSMGELIRKTSLEELPRLFYTNEKY